MAKRTTTIQVFGEALTRVIWSFIRYASVIDGEIVSIDEEKYTCVVKCMDAQFEDVPLKVLISTQASFIEIPKVGSSCLMTFRDVNSSRPQLLQVNESEKILVKIGTSDLEIKDGTFTFNGGELGGLVKVKVLQEESNKDKEILDALLQILTGNPINELGNGSPSALQAALAGVLAGKQSGTWDSLENEKILQ